MTPPAIVRGSRLFAAGAWTFVVFGLVHSTAVISSFFSKPTDPDMAALDEALRATHLPPIGPFAPTVWGAMQILSLSYTTFLLYAGASGLLMRRSAIAAGRLQRLAVLNLVLAVLLGGIGAAFQFPPPVVFAAVAAVLFAWSAAVAPRTP